jgi:hypothetical protein
VLRFLKTKLTSNEEERAWKEQSGKLRVWLNILTAQQCNDNECCGNSSPTCLFIYSVAGEEGEQPDRLPWLSGGPLDALNILNVFR